mmetsp:Transcript_34630/g.78952  ORF Transcript_34630/g.78952 Transcript_34630/m.78952 type:complete len:301 (-) Transcript_34630:419-1321(-)
MFPVVDVMHVTRHPQQCLESLGEEGIELLSSEELLHQRRHFPVFEESLLGLDIQGKHPSVTQFLLDHVDQLDVGMPERPVLRGFDLFLSFDALHLNEAGEGLVREPVFLCLALLLDAPCLDFLELHRTQHLPHHQPRQDLRRGRQPPVAIVDPPRGRQHLVLVVGELFGAVDKCLLRLAGGCVAELRHEIEPLHSKRLLPQFLAGACAGARAPPEEPAHEACFDHLVCHLKHDLGVEDAPVRRDPHRDHPAFFVPVEKDFNNLVPPEHVCGPRTLRLHRNEEAAELPGEDGREHDEGSGR